MEEKHIKLSGLNGDKDNMLVVDDGKDSLLAALMAMAGGSGLVGDNALVESILHDSSPKVKTFNSSAVERFSVEEWKDRKLNRPQYGRNEKCSCGSGKKYKNCHGKIFKT